jgi:hypothetical protein
MEALSHPGEPPCRRRVLPHRCAENRAILANERPRSCLCGRPMTGAPARRTRFGILLAE